MITRVPRFLLAGVMIGSLSAPLAAQQDFSNVQIRTERLTEGLFVLMGAGGNIGLSIGEDGPFVVDDQFAPLTAKIKIGPGDRGGHNARDIGLMFFQSTVKTDSKKRFGERYIYEIWS